MANTKNSLLRTKIIDRCLSDKRRKYSTQDMMDKIVETVKNGLSGNEGEDW